MQENENTVIILLSGGVDSTALVQYYQSLNYNAKGIYIDYGQASKNMEIEAVEKVSEHYRINTEIWSLALP